jgi:radical SAM superfamily enzyme YgiQ (UPF0313 family)
VVAEIESLYVPHVFIVDDVFFCERHRALEIHDLIKARGICKEYAAYCRADFIVRNEDVLRAWKDIGLRVLRVGMEAIHDGELQDYNKRISSECNLEAVEVCRRLGLELSASFLIRPDYGKRNFARLRAYVLRTGLTHVFLNPLTPLPGTVLHEQLKNDVIADHRRMAPLWDFQHSVLKPTKLSLKSFYHQMGMTYLMAVNPFRPRKLGRYQGRCRKNQVAFCVSLPSFFSGRPGLSKTVAGRAHGSQHAPNLTQNLPGGGDIYPDSGGFLVLMLPPRHP